VDLNFMDWDFDY